MHKCKSNDGWTLDEGLAAKYASEAGIDPELGARAGEAAWDTLSALSRAVAETNPKKRGRLIDLALRRLVDAGLSAHPELVQCVKKCAADLQDESKASRNPETGLQEFMAPPTAPGLPVTAPPHSPSGWNPYGDLSRSAIVTAPTSGEYMQAYFDNLFADGSIQRRLDDAWRPPTWSGPVPSPQPKPPEIMPPYSPSNPGGGFGLLNQTSVPQIGSRSAMAPQSAGQPVSPQSAGQTTSPQGVGQAASVQREGPSALPGQPPGPYYPVTLPINRHVEDPFGAGAAARGAILNTPTSGEYMQAYLQNLLADGSIQDAVNNAEEPEEGDTNEDENDQDIEIIDDPDSSVIDDILDGRSKEELLELKQQVAVGRLAVGTGGAVATTVGVITAGVPGVGRPLLIIGLGLQTLGLTLDAFITAIDDRLLNM